jgi:hypothetical protein
VDAAIPLIDVAAAVGIRPNTLTNYLTGRLRSTRYQQAIWECYCFTACHDLPLAEFWGDLLNPRFQESGT